jgi:hypothetical protein
LMIFDDFLMTFWWFLMVFVSQKGRKTLSHLIKLPNQPTLWRVTVDISDQLWGNTIQEFEPKAISSRRVPKCQWFLIECLWPKGQNSAGSRWLRSCDFPCNKILFARWLLKQEAADSWFLAFSLPFFNQYAGFIPQWYIPWPCQVACNPSPSNGDGTSLSLFTVYTMFINWSQYLNLNQET